MLSKLPVEVDEVAEGKVAAVVMNEGAAVMAVFAVAKSMHERQ